METIVPKCVNNNICSHICNTKTCKSTPFLCVDDQCSCHLRHQKCSTLIKWKIIKQSFTNKLKKPSSQLLGYLTHVEDIYKSVVKEIEKSSLQIKNISEKFGLSQLEREVYQKLKQNKFSELTGEIINKVQAELLQYKKQYQVRIIEKQEKQIEKQTTILVSMLERLTKLAQFKLDSKITQDVQTLSSFFLTKRIMSMNLIFRASENNFQINKFWDICDGIKDTIVILKTSYGNIIGGYTPLAWQKTRGWLNDSNMQSFIFSLTQKHKLELMKGHQCHAILNNYGDSGPVFGSGYDLWIPDQAKMYHNADARPGSTYNYNNEYGTKQSYRKFGGEIRFGIQEWQVHSVVFR